MILAVSILTAGLITLFWSSCGLFLMRIRAGEKVFTSNRPSWLKVLCWLYLTFAFTSWAGFIQNKTAIAFLVTGLSTLSAAKFTLFYFFYFQWQRIFILLWNGRKTLTVVMSISLLLGVFMVYAARLVI